MAAKSAVITLALAGVFVFASVSPAQAASGCPKTFSKPMLARAVDALFAGARDVSREDRQNVRGFFHCARPSVDLRAMRQYRRIARLAWRQRRIPSGYDSPVLSDVPGVPASFAACVAFRESDNGLLGDTVYGIIPASGYDVLGAPLSVQKHAFHDLYVTHGVSPWAPYDGC